jgi:signal transduction histidine kinase
MVLLHPAGGTTISASHHQQQAPLRSALNLDFPLRFDPQTEGFTRNQNNPDGSSSLGLLRALTPWWETLWFRGLMVFMLLGLVSAGAYGWHRANETRRTRLEALVENRTQELEELNLQLRSEITERSLFEQALKVTQNRLTGMLEISRTIVSTLEPTPLRDLILEQLAGVAPYDGAAVLTFDGDTLEMQASCVPFPLPEAPPERVPMEQLKGIERLLGLDPVYYLPDIHEDMRFANNISRVTGCPVAALLEYPTWLAIQLLFRDELIGFLILFHKELDHYSEMDRALAQAFANHAATAIHNSRLLQQMQAAAVVDERSRLARELHDSVTQALYSLMLYNDASVLALEAGRIMTANENLAEVRKIALEAMADLRLLIFDLRPPVLEQEGLVAAIQARMESVEARAGLKTELFIEGEDHLTAPVETELYWIVQESLNNILKHAQAKHVYLSLKFETDHVILIVEDDGVGFSVMEARLSGGLGLSNLEERVKNLGGANDIQSTPGQGTVINIQIPF